MRIKAKSLLIVVLLTIITFTLVSCTQNVSFTVYFNSNGGSEVNSITTDGKSTVTVPTNPEKVGYTFEGWYWDNETFQTAFSANSLLDAPLSSDMTVYAKWDPITYTISYVLNGGINNPSNLTTFNIETTNLVINNPTKEGYTFGGWYSDAAFTTAYSFTTMPANDITVYAKWNISSYTLQYVDFNDTVLQTMDYAYNADLSSVTAPVASRTGYSFTGWDMSLPLTMPASNIILKAQYSINQYTINFEMDGGSSVDSITQDYATAVTQPNNPTKEGYTFGGWYSDAAFTTAYSFTTMPANDITVYAKWNISSYTLQYVDFNDTVLQTMDYAYNADLSSVTAPVASRTGYSFTGWDMSLPLTMPASNIILKAQYSINQYTINFEMDGGSSVDSITQDYATAVTQPNNPTKEGYTFGGWYSDAAFTTAYSFTTMPANDITLYAKWQINQYSIIFLDWDGSQITSESIDYNTSLNEISYPSDLTRFEAVFTGWDTVLPSTMPSHDIVITATYLINQYKITFNENGGNQVQDIIQNYGSEINEPTDPTREGYSFLGWYTESEFLNEYTFSIMPNENFILYAKWTINQYTISFDENGGSIVNSITENFKFPIVQPNNPSKEGYSFGGWYSDNSFTTAYIFTTMPAGNITLYAKWQINQYSIIFLDWDGSQITSDSIDYDTNLNEFSFPSDPTRFEAIFSGWDTVLPSTMPSYDIVITATYVVNEYTIIFNSSSGSQISPVTLEYGSTINEPMAPTREGYSFSGWYTESEFLDVYTFSTMPNENLFLYAKWTINQYTISFNSNGGTAVTAITQDYAATVIVPTEPTRIGYTFGGWYNDEVLTQTYTFTTIPASNITLYAKWTINQYTITFNSNGGTAVTAITQDYAATVIAPTEPTRTGYTFGGWYSDEALTQTYTFTTMAASNIKLYAKWTINQYTITFNSNGGSAISNFTQDFNSTVTEPTEPSREEYTFGGWYSDEALTQAYTFTTMAASNITLYAKWNIIAYEITYNLDGGTNGSNPSTYNITTATITLADPTKEGYTFVGWYDNAAYTGDAVVQITIGSTGNVVLYAKWSGPETYNVSYLYTNYAITGSNYDLIQYESYDTSSLGGAFTYGDTVTLLNPNIVGHTFLGWYLSPDFSGDALSSEYIIQDLGNDNQNITLYGKSVVETYSIFYTISGSYYNTGTITFGIRYRLLSPGTTYYINGYYYYVSGWKINGVNYGAGDYILSFDRGDQGTAITATAILTRTP